MKKCLLVIVMMINVYSVNAQDPITEIIKAGVRKVIRSVDLKIQRLQNETIWLQNAQKAIENTLSKLRLDEITDWVEKQRTLYQNYFEELGKVKNVIAYYHRVRGIIDKQVRIVGDYKRAYTLFKKDEHFSAEEIIYMGKVYTGILDKSMKNVDAIFMVINSFATTMTDAKRMEIINSSAEDVDKTYNDLQTFNRQNMMLSLQRAKDLNDAKIIKALYGIE